MIFKTECLYEEFYNVSVGDDRKDTIMRSFGPPNHGVMVLWYRQIYITQSAFLCIFNRRIRLNNMFEDFVNELLCHYGRIPEL